MALLLKRTMEAYKYARDDLKDPRTADWFLVHSPIHVMFVMMMNFVLVKAWLPMLMENRKPYNLRRILVIYNFIQIVCNAYIFLKAMGSINTINLTCWAIDDSNSPDATNMTHVIWGYYMLKLLDMMDTVFMVLRKKHAQVSFLHVYHHCGVILVGWFGVKYVPGGESLYVVLFNTFVHIVMYGYYLFAAWKPTMITNKWKKHITQLQLLQFVLLIMIYIPKTVSNCSFPKFPLLFIIPQLIGMVLMFGEFYYHAYIKRK